MDLWEIIEFKLLYKHGVTTVLGVSWLFTLWIAGRLTPLSLQGKDMSGCVPAIATDLFL